MTELDELSELDLVPMDVQHLGRMMFETAARDDGKKKANPLDFEDQFQIYMQYQGRLQKVKRVFFEFE